MQSQTRQFIILTPCANLDWAISILNQMTPDLCCFTMSVKSSLRPTKLTHCLMKPFPYQPDAIVLFIDHMDGD